MRLSSVSRHTSCTRCQPGFTLLETLVALAVLVTLTMVVASIYKHHTSAPTNQTQEQADIDPRPKNLSPAEMPPLRDPVDTLAPSGR